MVRNRRLDRAALRAVVVNAGSANAATGSPGVDDADAMARRAAAGLGLLPEQVAVCSTGTIGDRIDLGLVGAGIGRRGGRAGRRRRRRLRAGHLHHRPRAQGRRVPPRARRRRGLIGAAAKGAGMISPGMATMLAYVTVGAAVDAAALQAMTAAAAAASFNRISVDGQMSPSDTLLRRWRAPTARPSPARTATGSLAGLAAVCRWLAMQIVRDGEGAEHAVRVLVSGARDPLEAERVARAVGRLAAGQGGDLRPRPELGAMTQAVGAALAGRRRARCREPGIFVDERALRLRERPAGARPRGVRPGDRPRPGLGRRRALGLRPEPRVRRINAEYHT